MELCTEFYAPTALPPEKYPLVLVGEKVGWPPDLVAKRKMPATIKNKEFFELIILGTRCLT
jgi:hypothetical protein